MEAVDFLEDVSCGSGNSQSEHLQRAILVESLFAESNPFLGELSALLRSLPSLPLDHLELFLKRCDPPLNGVLVFGDVGEVLLRIFKLASRVGDLSFGRSEFGSLRQVNFNPTTTTRGANALWHRLPSRLS